MQSTTEKHTLWLRLQGTPTQWGERELGALLRGLSANQFLPGTYRLEWSVLSDGTRQEQLRLYCEDISAPLALAALGHTAVKTTVATEVTFNRVTNDFLWSQPQGAQWITLLTHIAP